MTDSYKQFREFKLRNILAVVKYLLRTARRKINVKNPVGKSLILYITSVCNLHCDFCCYGSKLNKGGMSYTEFERIFQKEDFANLLITGGEPFLNDDIEFMLTDALRQASVSVNTNGTIDLCDRIDWALSVHDKCSKQTTDKHYLTVSVSIDGFMGTHNKLRGNPEAYQKALDTLRDLESLKRKYDNLRIVVNTVLLPENLKEVPELIKEFYYGFDLDFHNVEIARDINWDVSLLDAFHLTNYEMYSYYPNGYNRWYFRLKTEYDFLNNIKWGFNCKAGETLSVIYEDGRKAICEYDKERACKDGDSFCMHGCWIEASMPKQKTHPYKQLYKDITKYLQW